jgi:hypothetical protein
MRSREWEINTAPINDPAIRLQTGGFFLKSTQAPFIPNNSLYIYQPILKFLALFCRSKKLV